MPHDPHDNRYPHLPLVAEDPNPQRRRRSAPPSPPPDRGGRASFAEQLRQSIDDLEQEVTRRPRPPVGIQPHLVFRVPLARSASSQIVAELLERLGIRIVGIESDRAIIAFRDEANLSEFRQAVAAYERGPQEGINPRTGKPYEKTQWDVLEYVEAANMRLWNREDRIGRRLAHGIGEHGQAIQLDKLYRVDVELWHRGTDELARAAVRELSLLVDSDASSEERVCDTFIGDLLCLARVAVRGPKLDALLNLDIVAEVELPPQPVFDARAARFVTARDFPAPPLPAPDGPAVCVVDSGVATNHPLLANNMGHAEAVVPDSDSPADEYGHGTMVGALAVFGDVRRCYESGGFASPVTLYSARVLNNENRFDDERLIIHQMRRAVEIFINPPYNCRVFNFSLGDNAAWFQNSSRQSLWAESLDVLAREFDAVFVASAGNHNLGWANTTDEAEEVLIEYPDFLFRPECGLCEPATAAIPITVGGVAEYDHPEVRSGRRGDDLIRAIAGALQPSPTTRIGPGLNDAIKPEFVAPAGNVAFEGVSSARWIRDNPGIAVMSFSHQPVESLFAYDIGTSLAAPRIARTAALLLSTLQQSFNEEPSANLIRAVLASSAKVPLPLRDRIQPEHGEEGVRKVCGYGMVDDELAFESADRRVSLVTQGTLPIDSFVVYEVPVPLEFRQAPGAKTVIVTLAYDPPVRRRRAGYLGVQMDSALIRGKTLDEIVDAYRAVSTEEREAAKSGYYEIQGAFQPPYRCPLKPGPNTLKTSTLQRSEWTFQRENQDYGDSWYLVVRAQRIWAPETITEQRFAATVTLHADQSQLYSLVRNRVEIRLQQRARARQ